MLDELNGNIQILNEKLNYIEILNLPKQHRLHDEIADIIEKSDKILEKRNADASAINGLNLFKERYSKYFIATNSLKCDANQIILNFEDTEHSYEASSSEKMYEPLYFGNKNDLYEMMPYTNNSENKAKKRKHKVEEISRRVNEIANIQNYLDCLVKVQNEKIDNLVFRIRKDEHLSTEAVKELRQALGKKKGKRSIIWYFIYIIMGIFSIWILKSFIIEGFIRLLW